MGGASEFPEEGEELRRTSGDGGDEGKSVRVPRPGPIGRISDFYQSIKLELRKTTWPTRTEVRNTTVVVLIAVVFFGFYLWGADKVIALGFDALEQFVRR